MSKSQGAEPGNADWHPGWSGLYFVTARTAVSKWQAMALRYLVEPDGVFPRPYFEPDIEVQHVSSN